MLLATRPILPKTRDIQKQTEIRIRKKKKKKKKSNRYVNINCQASPWDERSLFSVLKVFPYFIIYWLFEISEDILGYSEYTGPLNDNNNNNNEPPHDKTNKVAVRTAKTQISLGLRPVWTESSLSAWRKLGSLATNWAHSEASD